MNLLMTIAVIGAALIGQWPEAAVVIWLFGIAEILAERSKEMHARVQPDESERGVVGACRSG